MSEPVRLKATPTIVGRRLGKSAGLFVLSWGIQAWVEREFDQRLLVSLNSDVVRREIWFSYLFLFLLFGVITLWSLAITAWVIVLGDALRRFGMLMRTSLCAVVVFVFCGVLILGPRVTVDEVLAKKAALESMMSQSAEAYEVYRSVPRNQPIQFAQIPPQDFSILDDIEGRLKIRWGSPELFTAPLVCATMYNPLALGEGSRFSYGFVFATPDREVLQYVSITGDGRLGSRVNSFGNSRPVPGFQYLVSDNAFLTWDYGIGMNMCLLIRDDYVHLFADDVIVQTWRNDLQYDLIRVGVFYDLPSEWDGDLPTLEVRDFRIIATRESKAYKPDDIDTVPVATGTPPS